MDYEHEYSEAGWSTMTSFDMSTMTSQAACVQIASEVASLVPTEEAAKLADEAEAIHNAMNTLETYRSANTLTIVGDLSQALHELSTEAEGLLADAESEMVARF